LRRQWLLTRLEGTMKKLLLFLLLGFALFAAPAAVMYPQQAHADGCTGSNC
jgi:hypothetical protein